MIEASTTLNSTYTDRVLALAGILQAVRQVQKVANEGRVCNDILATSLQAVLNTDPDTADEVFGGVRGVQTGLDIFYDQLAGPSRDLELTRYLIALLHLEGKLKRRPDLLATIAEGVERARAQTDHFPVTHANVIANLADVYANTVSTLRPRIMVSGQHGHLSNPSNANLVRALLLAGIRGAVLWGQCGGSRLQLLLKRKPFLEEARRLSQISI